MRDFPAGRAQVDDNAAHPIWGHAEIHSALLPVELSFRFEDVPRRGDRLTVGRLLVTVPEIPNEPATETG